MKLFIALAAISGASLLLAVNPSLRSNQIAVQTTLEEGWQMVKTKNEPLARHENAFAALDGKFYLIGGRNNKPINIYDPTTNTWSEGATPPLEMHHFQALPFQGKIYVMGAFTGGYPHEDPIPDIYAYDPATDSWDKAGTMPANRRRGAAGVVTYNDKIYVVCGIQDGHYEGHTAWLDEYDPATGKWKQLTDAPRTRDHFQAAVIGDKLYAAAGRNTSAKTNQSLELTIGEVDVYDFKTGKWETLDQPLPTLRAGTGAIPYENRLIIIGGESGSQVPAHAEAEAYDVASSSWKILPSLNQGRHGTQSVLFNNTIFVAAGSGDRGGGPELTSMEKYQVGE